MGVLTKFAPKNYKYNKNNPQSYGVCDYSGFIFPHCDLIKQKDWRGNNYVWTGLMVGKPFIDKPQPQNRPPMPSTDPNPVTNSRPPSNYIDPESNPVLPSNQLMNKLNNFNWGDD